MAENSPGDARIDVYLICNAKYHDTNFARLELLKLLAEHEDVVVRVAEDYRDHDAIRQSRLLVTYTCDVCPTPEQQEGLKQFLSSGGRWFALHGTSALLEFVGQSLETDGIVIPGKVDTPGKPRPCPTCWATILCRIHLFSPFTSRSPTPAIRSSTAFNLSRSRMSRIIANSMEKSTRCWSRAITLSRRAMSAKTWAMTTHVPSSTYTPTVRVKSSI